MARHEFTSEIPLDGGPPVSLEAWRDLLQGRCDPDPATLSVALRVDRVSSGGGSQPIRILTDEGHAWWIKDAFNGQDPIVMVNEHVVGRIGELIDAAVCHVGLIWIPPEIAGPLDGIRVLASGVAHGKLDVDGCREDRSLLYREYDDNGRRHAGLYGLYDLCWGSDPQWLYKTDAHDRRIFSHDHGHYIGCPQWTADELLQRVDASHTLEDMSPYEGLDRDALNEYAHKIRSITREDIRKILLEIPCAWGIANDQLETLGFFLERRASQVAARLEQASRSI